MKGLRIRGNSSGAEYSAFKVNKEEVLDQLYSLFIPIGFSTYLQVISPDTSATVEFTLCHNFICQLKVNKVVSETYKWKNLTGNVWKNIILPSFLNPVSVHDFETGWPDAV